MIAAAAASPDPVGLPTTGAGVAARQDPSGAKAVIPAAPSETTTALAPRRLSAVAAAATSERPVVWRSSPEFSFTMSAPAAAAWRSASPTASTRTTTRCAVAMRTSRAQASSPAPGGRLPDTTSAVASGSLAASLASRSLQLVAATRGPGSLNSVASWLRASTTAMDRRVGPSTATSSWASPPRARSVVMASAVAPPTSPRTKVSWPSAWRALATLTPLPPARSSTLRTRWLNPGVSWSTR